MNTPEQISSETREQFPIGSLVRLSPKGAKFTPKRWHARRGKIIGHASRVKNGRAPVCCILLVVWEGRTRRRICRKHRSDFVLCVPRKREKRGRAVGGPQCSHLKPARSVPASLRGTQEQNQPSESRASFKLSRTFCSM